MPRRKRRSKLRRELSLREILDEVLPPNPLVRRGPDEDFGDGEVAAEDVDFGGGRVGLDDDPDRSRHGAM